MPELTSATSLKLEKAKYYLHRMKETQHDPFAFQCELESFLIHANSVTSLPAGRTNKNTCFLEKEVARREPGKVLEFQAWYDQKVLELQGNPIMHFLREERHIAVHYNHSEVHSTRQYALKMSFTDYVSAADSVEMTTVYVDVPENTNFFIQQLPAVPLVAGKPIFITIGHPEHTWLFDTDKIPGDKGVISVCEQHIHMIESILEDCQKHGFL